MGKLFYYLSALFYFLYFFKISIFYFYNENAASFPWIVPVLEFIIFPDYLLEK